MLFNMEEVYNLKTIEETTRQFVKKKFKKPVEEESIDEYRDFIDSEYKLELADRLKKMAERLEKEVKNSIKRKGY